MGIMLLILCIKFRKDTFNNKFFYHNYKSGRLGLLASIYTIAIKLSIFLYDPNFRSSEK